MNSWIHVGLKHKGSHGILGSADCLNFILTWSVSFPPFLAIGDQGRVNMQMLISPLGWWLAVYWGRRQKQLLKQIYVFFGDFSCLCYAHPPLFWKRNGPHALMTLQPLLILKRILLKRKQCKNLGNSIYITVNISEISFQGREKFILGKF